MQIYFFTRSGRSKKIAGELAARYQVQPEEIKDGKDWQGIGGYIKACLVAVKKQSLPGIYKKPLGEAPIALIFPIWAGTFPPAVRAFIEEVGREKIVCIPTSGGSKLKDRSGFIKVIDLAGSDIAAPAEL